MQKFRKPQSRNVRRLPFVTGQADDPSSFGMSANPQSSAVLACLGLLLLLLVVMVAPASDCAGAGPRQWRQLVVVLAAAARPGGAARRRLGQGGGLHAEKKSFLH